MEHEHSPDAIHKRLESGPTLNYLRDWIYGGIDGAVTTLAVVTGVAGAQLSTWVILALGFANLFADGFSMAASNYLGTRAEHDDWRRLEKIEHRHIDLAPEGEREEVRQIFARKGFADAALEHIVATITADRRLWVETMLAEEHGLRGEHPSPMKSGAVTFAAFVLVGTIPLLPLLFTRLGMPLQLYVSIALAALVFFAIGSLKSLFLRQPTIRSGLTTLLTGGSAAVLAYVVGHLLRNALGV